MLKGNRRPCACREGLPRHVQLALDEIVEALHAEHQVPFVILPNASPRFAAEVARLRAEYEAREHALIRNVGLWLAQLDIHLPERLPREPRH